MAESGSTSRNGDSEAEELVIFTDGACKGNPGPGGWAWVTEDGPWCSGYEPAATNQRMEITAAYRAVLDNPGRLRIVSDSTYVVNCFRDRWWEGWRKRNWKNSRKEPVANRDLWEPFVDLVEDRHVTFEWVKGHSGHTMNDLADRLAVEAIERRSGSKGDGPPSGAADSLEVPPTEGSSPASSVRDRRVPPGHLWAVVGVRCANLTGSEAGNRLRERMARIIEAQQQMHGDLVILTGARPGAEQLGSLAAVDAGVPYVVVLPYPDPVPRGAGEEWKRFVQICDGADSVVTLESKRPLDRAAKEAALARRDGWLRSVSSGALVVTVSDSQAGQPAARSAASAARSQFEKFSRVLAEEVWELQVP